ncbi:MAG: aminotransferase class IV [Longimicrobiales bacterium]
MIVYLNGAWIPHSDAKVSVDDRGFLFADGVYEVVRAYEGRLFLLGPHLQRMRAGLAALQIDPICVDPLEQIMERLLDENGLRHADATVYVQVTRGAAPRQHAFPPAHVPPTVFAAANRFTDLPHEFFEQGVPAITVPDTRWTRCDIKAVSLLANVLANQQAKAHGAFEAVFIRDGALLEGSHSNLFGVIDGELRTYPECNYILGGITRRLTLELARETAIPARETPIYWHERDRIEELFLAGTTTEIMPVTTLDGAAVGTGAPGPITRRLLAAFREFVSTREPAISPAD